MSTATAEPYKLELDAEVFGLQLSTNLSATKRQERYQGREYLVVPVTLIVPGILAGNEGALFYPPEEVRKSTKAWNGVPIILEHSYNGDTPISARNPSVLDRQQLGQVFNATFENGKLKAEGWFDVELTKAKAPDVLSALNSAKKVEVSTGLVLDRKVLENEYQFNGASYKVVAINYRPDHLAILPNSVGACSVRDGCGLNVNKNSTADPTNKESTMDDAKKKAIVDALIANVCCWEEDDRPVLEAMSNEKLEAFATNAKQSEQQAKLAKAAKEGFEDQQGYGHQFNEKTGKWESKPPKKKEPEPAPTTNEGQKLPENWKDLIPPEDKAMLANASTIVQTKKAELIQALTANVKDQTKKEQVVNRLDKLDLDALQEMSALVPEPEEQKTTANYAGAGAPPAKKPTFNREDYLPLPQMTFAEPKTP